MATRLNLLHQIEQVYFVQHKVPISFWHCFKYSLKSYQDKSDNFLENWLILYEKLILESAQDPKRQQNITEFFPFYLRPNQVDFLSKLSRSKSAEALHTEEPFNQEGEGEVNWGYQFLG